jgi:phenylalanyl-tRNA synthetase beta chain
VSWLREYAAVPDVPATDLAAALIRAGLEVETVDSVGADLAGVVVGEVLALEQVPGTKKPIRWCSVTVGAEPRGVICGATNFAVGDRVAVALPGAVLPGGFAISARKTYGHVSDGMICSARELGIGEDASGILVLPSQARPGEDLATVLGLRDDVLDIAVTPDRGYCLSLRGVAREAATAYGVAYTDPARADRSTGEPAGEGHPVVLSAGADRIVLRTVTGFDPAARSPQWLQRRLTLCGMRPVSLAVDVTNYVMLELGQPLHAFDRDKLSGGVVVRKARAGERLTTLDHAERVLDPDDTVIADDTGPVALAGTMGGLATEIGPGSTDLVIEAAHFEPETTGRMARRHKLPSEASRRFERGVDPELPSVAAARAVQLLVELGGAAAGGGARWTTGRRRPPCSCPSGWSPPSGAGPTPTRSCAGGSPTWAAPSPRATRSSSRRPPGAPTA